MKSHGSIATIVAGSQHPPSILPVNFWCAGQADALPWRSYNMRRCSSQALPTWLRFVESAPEPQLISTCLYGFLLASFQRADSLRLRQLARDRLAWNPVLYDMICCGSARHDPPHSCHQGHAAKYRRALTAIVVPFRHSSGIRPMPFQLAGK